MNPLRKTVVIAALTAMVMFGFSFAMSPLYNAFCKVTGLNTSIRIVDQPDFTHSITVQFVSTNNQQLAWEFYPRTTSIIIHPDETMKVVFFAKNTTNKTMTVQAIPSFSPGIAARYFHKIKCFCFNQQTLAAGESAEMPVIFRIDKNLPADIHAITLAYTLFDVTRMKK